MDSNLLNIFFTLDELISFLGKPMEVPAWVSNTQKVEKAIADLNEAGKHVRGEEGRDGLLLAYAEGRKVLPEHKTKADYASFVEADVSFKKEKG